MPKLTLEATFSENRNGGPVSWRIVEAITAGNEMILQSLANKLALTEFGPVHE